MIDYYSELCQVAEDRTEKIMNHVKTMSSIQIDNVTIEKSQSNSPESSIQVKANSSSESFYSAPEDLETAEIKLGEFLPIDEEPEAMRSSESMDLLNANIERTDINPGS